VTFLSLLRWVVGAISLAAASGNAKPDRSPFGQAARVNDRFALRIQPNDATVWWNRSAGVSKFNVFLGRSFNLLATALSLA
jgi:hypothetical protein